MIGPSALSVAARELRARLAAALDLAPANVLIGPPAAAAKELEREPRTLLNLFVHRIEPAGQGGGEAALDPFQVRAHALITAFAEPESDAGTQVTVSAGEIDLRLIGGALRALHEQPVLRLRDDAGEEVAQLQLLFAPLSLDDINHLWATQGDAPYRLSVGCELALLPLPLARRVERAPRVGALDLKLAPLGAPAEAIAPPGVAVPPVRVDTALADWAPAIRFVDAAGRLQLSLSLARSATPPHLLLAVAGAPGSEVTLAWQRWDRARGWRDVPADGSAPLPVDRPSFDDGWTAHAVALPLDGAGQAMVYAVRTWQSAPGAVQQARSNPLLVSVSEGAPV